MSSRDSEKIPNSIAPEILRKNGRFLPVADANVVVPKIGDKKKLLELSANNVKYYQPANASKPLPRTTGNPC
ncbi:MAG: hypothetical protein R2795_13940 [Saprospiraceae bacterium]